MTHSTFIKSLAAFAAGLLALSCTKTVEAQLSLSDLAANFEATGSLEKTVSVTSNTDWTVSCADSWVTVTPSSGSGNGSFKIAVSENTTFEARSSTVTVKAGDKSSSVKVSQLSLAPTLEVNPIAVFFTPESSSVELSVTTNAPWTVTVSEDWLKVEPASGQGDGKVVLTVTANVLHTERNAVVTVKETVGNTEKTVNVNQEALPLGRRVDSLALVALYNASKGAEWTKGNWDLNADMGTWTGVTLTEGRVTALKLTTTVAIPDNWTLPDEMEDLTALTDLRINKQKLSGDFPKVLCRMTWLKTLYLQGNNLSGALPAELGQMTELTDLYVDQNASMTGSIPKEIGNLKKLQRLNISQSGIGGEIPVELGQCEELMQFMAFKCNLSGTLPDIWDMPKLQTVMVHTCPGLTGMLPASLSKLKKIATAGPSIQVHSCNFTGNIPECFAELDGGEKKVQVHVYGNKMSGVIPASVQAHKDFASWKINPQQEGFELRTEDYSRQTDSLALVALYNASKGAEWTKGNWDLTKNMGTWTGVTLTGGRVTALKLTTTVAIPENWTLPNEIVTLSALTDLRINKQKLSGDFPALLCSMDWLKILYLQGNNLTGALPAELGQMKELTDLYVDQNASMTGSIPKQIGKLKKLQRLNISQSGIGGEIPVELGQCDELLQFMAFKSQLSGTLPDIWDMPKLQTFMVHTCPGLTGPLPASLGKLKKIATAGPSIQVHTCNITGNIPESFAELDGGEKKVQVHIYGNQMSGVIPASVQAHKDFASWKINPQQEGYELTTE